jgi:hypothetical protein
MGRSPDGELKARRLELKKAMAELTALREQVAMAERSILGSQYVPRALSPPHAPSTSYAYPRPAALREAWRRGAALRLQCARR